jgi:EpsI family protein
VSALMLATVLVLETRSDQDRVPPHAALDTMPEQILAWQARDIPLDPEVLQVLGDGKFLNRVYEEPATAGTAQYPAGPVGLFIGYFPTQRTGQAIHSPQNCLPGAGWTFLSSQPITLTDVNGKKYDVGEYLITDGNIKQDVLYWYREQGRSVSNEYRAKLYMIEDAIRHNRTDGALVRVITPMQPGETFQQVHNRAVAFTAQLAPMLPTYIPD